MAPRRSFSTSPPRRKRIWARQRTLLTGITNAAPQQVDLLAGLKVALGGGMPIGATVGPIKLAGIQVSTTTAGATVPSIVLGARVGSQAIEAVDQDPAALVMLDWCLFTALQAPPTVGPYISHIWESNSKRKLEEVQDVLWLVGGTVAVATTMDLVCYSSVLVILP